MSNLNEAWEIFKQGVGSVLRQWTALRLAIENNWGGGDSNRKAANLEAELIDMFRTKKQLYRDDVEDYLNAYLDDNFGTYAEDGSPTEVALLLLEIFKQCGALNYELVQKTLQTEAALKAKGLRSVPAEGADEPDDITCSIKEREAAGGGADAMDEDSSGSDSDTATAGAAAAAAAQRAPAPPRVDADGWETVGGKGKKKGQGRA